MKRIFLILAISALAGVGMAGCSRSESSSGPATQPSPPVAAIQTAIQPSAQMPAPAKSPATTNVSRPPSVMVIDQKRYEFPPGILQIRTKDGQLTATLMSDDPKDAINENYHGNSFYIQMPLDVTDIKDLDDSPWRFSDTSGERSDSPNGIFLDGNRIQLQPSTAQVKFAGKPPEMTVTVSGQFAQFQTHDDSVGPKTATVMGEFEAQVHEK